MLSLTLSCLVFVCQPFHVEVSSKNHEIHSVQNSGGISFVTSKRRPQQKQRNLPFQPVKPGSMTGNWCFPCLQLNSREMANLASTAAQNLINSNAFCGSNNLWWPFSHAQLCLQDSKITANQTSFSTRHLSVKDTLVVLQMFRYSVNLASQVPSGIIGLEFSRLGNWPLTANLV